MRCGRAVRLTCQRHDCLVVVASPQRLHQAFVLVLHHLADLAVALRVVEEVAVVRSGRGDDHSPQEQVSEHVGHVQTGVFGLDVVDAISTADVVIEADKRRP